MKLKRTPVEEHEKEFEFLRPIVSNIEHFMPNLKVSEKL